MAFEMDPDLLGLVDEVAIVTGGGGVGMGRAHCRQLARAGCHIVVADVDAAGGQQTVKEVEALGRKAVFVETDVLDAAQVQRMVQTAFDVFGRLDVAVNHVGGGSRGSAFNARFLDHTDEGWEGTIRQNLLATVLCARTEARAMVEHQTPGRIINVASVAGLTGSPITAPYGAAKAAIIHLTKTMAVELGPHNIRVNCIAPGFTPNERRPALDTPDAPPAMREFHEGYRKATPMRRDGEPMETAGLAVFFASKLAAYVTGQTLASDGGVTAAPAYPDQPTA